MDNSKNLMKSLTVVLAVFVLTLVVALILGTLLSQAVFTTLTIINTTELSGYFSTFVTGLLGFIGIIGIIIGIVWLIDVIKPVFAKKDGIQSFSGS